MNKELYSDWYSDNIKELMSDYIDNYCYEDFERFCHEQFILWRDER